MIAQQIREMRLFFGGDATRHMAWRYASPRAFPIVANDGTAAPCQCGECTQWLSPQRGRRGLKSDQYAFHLREVARAAAQEFPDRAISALAYSSRVLPPTRVKLPDNVLMSLASGSVSFRAAPVYQKVYEQWVRDWEQTAKLMRAASLLDQAQRQVRRSKDWRVRTRLKRLRTQFNQALADCFRANYKALPQGVQSSDN
jgi:uncharacterized protein DUF4838